MGDEGASHWGLQGCARAPCESSVHVFTNTSPGVSPFSQVAPAPVGWQGWQKTLHSRVSPGMRLHSSELGRGHGDRHRWAAGRCGGVQGDRAAACRGSNKKSTGMKAQITEGPSDFPQKTQGSFCTSPSGPESQDRSGTPCSSTGPWSRALAVSAAKQGRAEGARKGVPSSCLQIASCRDSSSTCPWDTSMHKWLLPAILEGTRGTFIAGQSEMSRDKSKGHPVHLQETWLPSILHATREPC